MDMDASSASFSPGVQDPRFDALLNSAHTTLHAINAHSQSVTAAVNAMNATAQTVVQLQNQVNQLAASQTTVTTAPVAAASSIPHILQYDDKLTRACLFVGV
jgi:ABC-type transporter Mla subunit MlaD